MTSCQMRYLIRMRALVVVSMKCVTSHITRLADKKQRMSTSLERTTLHWGKQDE